MKILRAVWHAQLTSLRNASRYDTRMRVAGVILILFNLGVGYWSISQLLTGVQQWHALGQATLTSNLWFLCINVWLGIGVFSIIGMLNAVGSDETLLLFTLPISPAMRFRIFYSTFFVQNLWNWLLLEVGCIGYILLATLGTQGLLWLFLLQCGVAVSVGGVLVFALLFLRYVLFPDTIKTRIVVVVALSTALGLIFALYLLSQNRAQAIVQNTRSLASLSPVLMLFLFLSALFLLLGPFSRYIGNLYIAAFQRVQSGGSTRKAFTFPGVRLMNRMLTPKRSLVSAFFVKALLSQSRNWLFWFRILLVIVLLAFFPIVHSFMGHYGFSATLQVIAYASGVVVWHVLEVAPSALSGEANRLTLYLIAPLKPSQILRAKLTLFLLPVLIEGVLITLLLSWRIRLPFSQLWFAFIAVVCVVTATVALPVLGSIWDEDLNVTVEGAMQAILQEESPISPKRIGLLNLSVLLFISMLAMFWKMSPFFALISVIGSMAIVLIGMWLFSNVGIQRLTKGRV